MGTHFVSGVGILRLGTGNDTRREVGKESEPSSLLSSVDPVKSLPLEVLSNVVCETLNRHVVGLGVHSFHHKQTRWSDSRGGILVPHTERV